MPRETDVQTRSVELSKPEKLTAFHELGEFDCGEPSINAFLLKNARKAQEAKHSVVYVACFKGSNKVAGFYTLSSGAVTWQYVTPRHLQRNSFSSHPATILGRMGVTTTAQGCGFAEGLLKDAIRRVFAASETIATSAILVHPLNERLAEFYARKAGFVRCPELSPLTMMLSLR